MQSAIGDLRSAVAAVDWVATGLPVCTRAQRLQLFAGLLLERVDCGVAAISA